VKIFAFLLSPYNLVRTCNNLQKYNVRRYTEIRHEKKKNMYSCWMS
jgi:hypothetical protein